DLDRDRPLLWRVLRVLERPVDAADETFGAHHLGHDQATAAVALDQTAERRVGHARHRSDREWRRQLDGPDPNPAILLPTLATNLTRLYVGRVHFDADGLSDQIH